MSLKDSPEYTSIVNNLHAISNTVLGLSTKASICATTAPALDLVIGDGKKPPFQILAGSAIVVREALSGRTCGQSGVALWLAR